MKQLKQTFTKTTVEKNNMATISNVVDILLDMRQFKNVLLLGNWKYLY